MPDEPLTQPALHCDGHVPRRLPHGLAALCHHTRLQHQGRPEAASSRHLVRWAPAVQVNLIVSVLGRHGGSWAQRGWVAASQLAHDGVLLLREPQEPAAEVKPWVSAVEKQLRGPEGTERPWWCSLECTEEPAAKPQPRRQGLAGIAAPEKTHKGPAAEIKGVDGQVLLCCRAGCQLSAV